MRKLLRLGIALAALAGGPAVAADFEPAVFQSPPPPPILVPAFNWTGCYLGGHAGSGWSTWGYRDPTDNPTVPGTRNYVLANDFVVGGQVGCDYQYGNGVVVGAQGTFDWTQMKGRFHDAVTNNFDETAQARWYATGTGRVGYAMTPQSLLYAKGGVAFINNRYEDIQVAGFCGVPCNTVDSSPTQTRIGWTVGLGFEYMFLPNWSVFLEYNYLDFGTAAVAFPGAPPPGNTFQISQHVQTVMIGLNYRINLAPPPVVAVKY